MGTHIGDHGTIIIIIIIIIPYYYFSGLFVPVVAIPLTQLSKVWWEVSSVHGREKRVCPDSAARSDAMEPQPTP